MKIVVLGYIVRGPLGGMVWHHLQYVLGLKQLGHEVLFLEDSDDYESCYQPEEYIVSLNPAYGLNFLSNIFHYYDLQHQWAYFDAHTTTWHGWSKEQVYRFCNMADIVLNLSGINPVREWWEKIPRRILVDTDPVFTHIKHLADSKSMTFARSHTHFATFGENFGKPGCTIPDDGLPWKPTRQPIVLSCWQVTDPVPDGNWTTVMQWDSYKAGEYSGKIYGMKSMSFEPFLKFPEKVSDRIELALGSHNAPANQLKENGWIISDPFAATKTPFALKDFINRSKGEWSVAKHGYVVTNSGWFSERSLNYLASGKPVVVQETGFSHNISSGNGLLSFNNPDESKECMEKVNKDYIYHARKARQLVEEFFDSEINLTALIHI